MVWGMKFNRYYLEHPYHKKLEEAGHVLERGSDGEVDIFVLDAGYHNGPGCVKCGLSWCHHCEPEVKPCSGSEQ